MGRDEDCWFWAAWEDGSSWCWGSSVQTEGQVARFWMTRAGGGLVGMRGVTAEGLFTHQDLCFHLSLTSYHTNPDSSPWSHVPLHHMTPLDPP